MWSSANENEIYIGKILKKLNTGKTLKNLFLEATWTERAKLLVNLRQIRKYHEEFQKIMSE